MYLPFIKEIVRLVRATSPRTVCLLDRLTLSTFEHTDRNLQNFFVHVLAAVGTFESHNSAT